MRYNRVSTIINITQAPFVFLLCKNPPSSRRKAYKVPAYFRFLNRAFVCTKLVVLNGSSRTSSPTHFVSACLMFLHRDGGCADNNKRSFRVESVRHGIEKSPFVRTVCTEIPRLRSEGPYIFVSTKYILLYWKAQTGVLLGRCPRSE